MSAYLIANVDIEDPEKFKQYMSKTPTIIGKFGGKFLVRGGDFLIKEGDWNPKRIVVVEFPDMAHARRFYDSEEYTNAALLRKESSYTELILVDGVDGKKIV